jgi:hypothetical protein
MSNVVVRPEQFEQAVLKAIAQYGDDVLQTMEAETKSISRQTVSALKGSAPSGGSYSRGWSHKAQKGGAFKLSETVYNRTDYMLTHLLEKSHTTGPGGRGRYPKNVNYTGTIARIEEEYGNRYIEEVMSKL